jgi:hypothetical protein
VLNPIEIYFSNLQRKLLTRDDLAVLAGQFSVDWFGGLLAALSLLTWRASWHGRRVSRTS